MKFEERVNAFVKLNQVLSEPSASEIDEIITQAQATRWVKRHMVPTQAAMAE